MFGLNAISFLVSLAITLTVRGRFEEDRQAEVEPEHEGLLAGANYLFRERVLRRMAFAWLVFVLGMGMGMVADAPLAESFGAGSWGYGLPIACWGTGSVLGTAFGRRMNARTEPTWMVCGAAGVAVSAFGVGLFGLFPLVLLALLVMGTSDGSRSWPRTASCSGERRTRSGAGRWLRWRPSCSGAGGRLPRRRADAGARGASDASTRSRACSRLVQPWYFSRSSACGPTRVGHRPRTRCPATDYRGPGDCVILALDGGGRGAHGGAAGRAGAGHLPGRSDALAALAYIVYRLTGESAVWLSITLLLTMGVQGLVQLLASWLGDRFDRRRVLVASTSPPPPASSRWRSRGRPDSSATACVTAILESPAWAVAAASIPNLVDEETSPGERAGGESVGTSGASSGRSSAPSSWRSSPVTARRPTSCSARVRSCSASTRRRSWSRPGDRQHADASTTSAKGRASTRIRPASATR